LLNNRFVIEYSNQLRTIMNRW